MKREEAGCKYVWLQTDYSSGIIKLLNSDAEGDLEGSLHPFSSLCC